MTRRTRRKGPSAVRCERGHGRTGESGIVPPDGREIGRRDTDGTWRHPGSLVDTGGLRVRRPGIRVERGRGERCSQGPCRQQRRAQRRRELAAGARTGRPASLAMALAITALTAGGSSGRIAVRGGTLVPTCANRTSDGVVALERHGPGEEAEGDAAERVLVAGPADRLAGDLLGRAVVRRAHEQPVAVSPRGTDVALMRPKSDRYACSGRPGMFSMRTLPGLTSRCTSPIACAASSPAATCVMMLATRSGASGPPLRADQAREVAAGDEPGSDVQHAVGLACGVDGQDVRLVDGGDGA